MLFTLCISIEEFDGPKNFFTVKTFLTHINKIKIDDDILNLLKF
jgi:hypothetical protein